MSIASRSTTSLFSSLSACSKLIWHSRREASNRFVSPCRCGCAKKLFQKNLLIKEFENFCAETDWEEKLLFSEHHLSHAASAFYPSPFEEAIILTMDGVGEWATTSVAYGSGNHIEVRKEIHFPHSLGLLYSAFTYYTGFKVKLG